MEVKEAIEKRRSIRKFLAKAIPDSLINQLLEAARLAPSSTNLQPWRYLLIKEKETKKKLCQAAYGQRYIEEAPLVIACCGDMRVLEERGKNLEKLAEQGMVSKGIKEKLLQAYKQRLRTDSTTQMLLLVANCVISIEHMVLQATELGLGSCWVMFFKEEKIREILNLPPHLVLIALLPLGYPAEDPPARPRLKLEEIVFEENYGNPWRRN